MIQYCAESMLMGVAKAFASLEIPHEEMVEKGLDAMKSAAETAIFMSEHKERVGEKFTIESAGRTVGYGIEFRESDGSAFVSVAFFPDWRGASYVESDPRYIMSAAEGDFDADLVYRKSQ